MCGRFYIDDHTIKEIANVAPEINDVFIRPNPPS